MNQWRTCACVLGVLLLTGCTAAGAAEHAAGHATGHPPARATGHVTGKLLIEGGPIGPGGQQPGRAADPGTVTFTAAGHRPVQVGVGASGKVFRLAAARPVPRSRAFPGHRNRDRLG